MLVKSTVLIYYLTHLLPIHALHVYSCTKGGRHKMRQTCRVSLDGRFRPPCGGTSRAVCRGGEVSGITICCSSKECFCVGNYPGSFTEDSKCPFFINRVTNVMTRDNHTLSVTLESVGKTKLFRTVTQNYFVPFQHKISLGSGVAYIACMLNAPTIF